jgi:chorismate mutase
MSEELKEEIIQQVRDLFGDTSVSPETTVRHMHEIIAECKEQLQALREDGVEI